MAVSLTVGDEVFEAGSPDELHALFSTIGARLEPDGWGSRFPALMERLYQGRLPAAHAAQARAELAEVRTGLEQLPPDAVVWDIEDRARRPPEGDDVDPAIANLAEYFLTGDGQPLLGAIDAALRAAERRGEDVVVRATDAATLQALGLRVGPNVWVFGDAAHVDAVLGRLPGPLAGLREGLSGDALQEAHGAVAELRAAPAPPELRTQDGRDVLAILDEALAYGARAGHTARLEPIAGV